MDFDSTASDNQKFWGDRLEKRKVPTILHLISGKIISGNVYIKKRFRLIDDMNAQNQTGNFIVVTDLKKTQPEIPPPHLMYINIDQIVWLAPDSKLSSKEPNILHGDQIEKRQVKVTIRTSTGHEIAATAHVKKSLRSIDDLNLSKDEQQFLSLTEAKITNLTPPLPVVSYMVINRHQIVWMIPEE